MSKFLLYLIIILNDVKGEGNWRCCVHLQPLEGLHSKYSFGVDSFISIPSILWPSSFWLSSFEYFNFLINVFRRQLFLLEFWLLIYLYILCLYCSFSYFTTNSFPSFLVVFPVTKLRWILTWIVNLRFRCLKYSSGFQIMNNVSPLIVSKFRQR